MITAPASPDLGSTAGSSTPLIQPKRQPPHATSHFRFPHPLPQAGSGSGKPIDFRDRKTIKQRDAAHLLDQIGDPIASFTADGGYDQDQVTQVVGERHPDAAVVVPLRAGAVASASADTAPTQRDLHLRMIADRGQMAWQKASGYNQRAKVEASIGRYKRVIGDALRSRTDRTEATEVAVAAAALNRMLAFGRPNYVRIA